MTDPRIEPAARAIYADVNKGHARDKGWDEVRAHWQEDYRSNARAALAAADKAATITEAYALTECPSGTAVIDGEGIIVGRDTSGTWMEFGTEERFHSRDIALPAHVIHWGTE